ncbi:hypothetical protein EG328_011329 [Venturia inaequalis]|uniref:Secreted protein n=1 Tax=Venturia inaequalis TaxID=5025 RepID=A0A8H3U409_VENIN|nr:hypothetical protein EG328_011329 [Venturia inaequalis]
MKLSIATFALLYLPFAYGFEFASAIGINLCGRLFDGGYGWGRVMYNTRSAMCLDQKQMDLICVYRNRPRPNWRNEERNCEGDESCVPHEYPGRPVPDAGCVVLHSPSGVKGSGDMDNHACSSGLTIGNDDIYILSAVSSDKMIYDWGIRTCIIAKSGSSLPADTIYSKSPCPHTSTILKLAKKTTYQACVTTAVALAKTSVGFTWHIRSPAKTTRRGVGQQGKPDLSEMFTIVSNSNNTANDAVRIVIGD